MTEDTSQPPDQAQLSDDELAIDLNALRHAAEEREWAALQVTLAKLLNMLPPFAALQAVIGGLIEALPVVEGAYPADDPRRAIPRQLLTGIVSYGFAPERLPEDLVGDYDAPGGAQYLHAVLEIARASQRDRSHEERLAFLVSAAANTIIAQMGAVFYGKNPDLFARVRDNQVDVETGEYSDPDAAKIPIMMWMDEEVAALDTAQWLALADRVEQAYKSF